MRKLLSIAGAVLVVLTGVAAPGSAAPPGAQGKAARPERPKHPVTVTLITGDRVRVSESNGRQDATLVPDPAHPRTTVLVRRSQGHLYVIPAQAARLLAAGKLDQRLFDVTELVGQGYTDDRRATLPVILAADAGPLDADAPAARKAAPAAPAVPAGSRNKRKLARLSATAVTVSTPQARTFWSAVTGPAAAGQAPAKLAGGLGTIWFDGRVKASLDRSVPQIGAPAAHAKGLDGTGVKVAVLDCGIDDQNADVAPKVTVQADFVAEGDTDDHCGHGTHVASILAGSGANSGGKYRGVAPGATLLDGKVLDASGYGEDSGVLAGMQWAVEQGADVVNLSLGSGPSDGKDPASLAIDQLSASTGTLFVVAAGNYGWDETVSSPASADAALAVGAVDRQDVLADFSSRGPRLGDGAVKPEITGPGVDIVAAQADGTELGPVVEPDYISLSGTSMATPHVAGAAAILAQQHPTWNGAQLKAGLVATAHPNGEEPVWWQGSGRVDLAAATGSTLRADRGTVDFGFFDWPQGGDPAVGRTLTYTNDGTAPLTLDLAAALHDDDGKALPVAGLTLSPATLTLAAGQSGTVSVTVQPDEAGVGRWGGYLTASTGGTVLARAALGMVKESERYPLQVHVLDRSGKPATGEVFVDVINPETGDWAGPLGNEYGADQNFRVPPGTWSVAATTFSEDTAEVTQVLDPAVEVKADTSLTLSAKGAKEVVTTVRGPDTRIEIAQFGYVWTEAQVGSSVAGVGDVKLFAKPTAKAPRDDFQWFQGATRREPAVDGLVSGQHFGLDALGSDDRLDGKHTVTVTKAPAAGRRVTPAGAYVLLEATDAETPMDDAVAAAQAAGAGGVVLWSADPLVVPWVEQLGGIPVLSTGADGARLERLVRGGPRTMVLTGRVWSRPVFDLMRVVSGRVPADLTVRARKEDLVPVTNRFRSLGGGFTPAYHFRFGLAGGAGGWGVGIPAKLGTERTDYLTPGQWTDELDVQRTPYTGGDDWPLSDIWFGDVYQVKAGGSRQETWLDAVLRPGDTSTGSGTLVVFDGYLFGYLSQFPDASGHYYSGADADGASWTLRRGSTVVATGTDPFLELKLPAGSRRYSLSYDVAKSGAPTWQRSTSAHTVWHFTAPADPPPAQDPEEFAYAVVPTLRVDAKLPLDLANTAKAGSTATFEASAGLPLDADGNAVPVRISQLSFATSTDAGKRWTPATVTRVDGDTFKVTVRNGTKPGPVAVRVTASTPGGTTIEQEVQAAYALR